MIPTSTAALTSSGPGIAPPTSTLDPTDERLVESLRPHPDFNKHITGYSTAEISALSARGESAFSEPITVTQDGYVIDGHALWQLARLQKRPTIRCIVREMSREQALLCIIDRNRGSKGINDFLRILLALELEPWFKERAKLNQRIGGREKGSSQLTEAERLDVRQEIADAAGVSVGNVSKAKSILKEALPEVIEVLRLGEISISRGATWARLSTAGQRGKLREVRQHQGIYRTVSNMLKKHQPKNPRVCNGLRDILRGLTKLQHEPCLSTLMDPLDAAIRGVDQQLDALEAKSRAA